MIFLQMGLKLKILKISVYETLKYTPHLIGKNYMILKSQTAKTINYLMIYLLIKKLKLSILHQNIKSLFLRERLKLS